jgi:hypothetical protein
MEKFINKQLYEVGLTGLNDPNNLIKTSVNTNGIAGFYEGAFFCKYENNGVTGLKINYYNHKGEVILWSKGNKLLDYFRVRLENIDKGQKYWQPYGSPNHVFCTKNVIEAKQIDTLYITEGEKKAFLLSLRGFYAVGIGGKDNFSNKENKLILDQIKAIVKDKKVLNIVLLLDSDVYKINVEADDLATRPNSFASTVIRFNSLCRELNCNVHFAHIDESFLEQKITGIDDLINYYEGQNNDKATEKIYKELKQLSTGVQRDREFIKCYNVSTLSDSNIKAKWSLLNVTSFFEKYKDIIGYNREFTYKGSSYLFFEQDGKSMYKVTSWGDAKRYIRIGAKYFKIAYNERQELVLINTTKETIKDDTKSKNGAIFDHITKVDGTVYSPCNTEEYKEFVICYNSENDINTKSVYFNMYQKLNYNYKTAKGDFSNIQKTIEHLFGGVNLRGEQLVEFAYDYLTLLYFYPTTKLPTICFVSTERATGKSTFLHFLKDLFKSNAEQLDNSRFSDKWTSTYANKLLILVDETAQNEEQKQKKEQLKNLITSNIIWNESKGENAIANNFYGKFMFASNDEDAFMQIDNVENRFCVLKVKSLPERLRGEAEDVDILEKMKSEINCFLTFLYTRMQNHISTLQRATFYERRTRLYFDYEIYTTEALRKVQNNSEDAYIRTVRECLIDIIANTDKDVIYITPNDLKNMFDLVYTSAKIADALRKLKLESKMQRYDAIVREYRLTDRGSKELTYSTISKSGRAFAVPAKAILTDEEAKELLMSKINNGNETYINRFLDTEKVPF